MSRREWKKIKPEECGCTIIHCQLKLHQWLEEAVQKHEIDDLNDLIETMLAAGQRRVQGLPIHEDYLPTFYEQC